jgi:hypothetical protein
MSGTVGLYGLAMWVPDSKSSFATDFTTSLEPKKGSQVTKIAELNIPDSSVQLGCGTMKSSTAYSVQNELGSPAPKKRVKSHTNQRIVRISKLFFSCSSVCSVLPSLKYYKCSPKVAAEESIDSLLV